MLLHKTLWAKDFVGPPRPRRALTATLKSSSEVIDYFCREEPQLPVAAKSSG